MVLSDRSREAESGDQNEVEAQRRTYKGCTCASDENKLFQEDNDLDEVEFEALWEKRGRKYPPGVELDDGRSMLECYGDGIAFYDSLVKAASYSYVRSDDDTWLSKLRFLTPVDDPPESDGPMSSAMLGSYDMLFDDAGRAECCCLMNDYRAFTVSYCWKSWPREQDLVPFEIITSDGIRPNRTSSRLIQWAVSYAASQGMPFIWIDQECIEQSDNAEKQAHINEMDRIFRRATRVIAPLTTTIDYANYMFVVNEYRIAGDHDDLDDAVHRLGNCLSRDDWFGRAWTLQENISAVSHLDFLVAVELASYKSDFVVVPPFICQFLAQGHYGRLFGAAKCRLFPFAWVRDYRFDHDTDCWYNSYRENPGSEQHRLSAEQALKALTCKGIQLPEDRLSIIANICRYASLLDLAKCKRSGLDNSTCIFAQALFNGDMSLILAYRSYLDPQNKASRLDWTVVQASLSAVLGHLDAANNACEHARLSPETMEVRVRGQLWMKRYLVDFSDFFSKHRRYASLPSLPKSEQEYVLNLILLQLLQESGDVPLRLAPLAMALIFGERLTSPELCNINPFFYETPANEDEARRKASVNEILSLFSFGETYNMTSEIAALMEAKVEVYMPVQAKECLRGIMIFWNDTLQRAPAALFTSEKTIFGLQSWRQPFIAWTLQSSTLQNGCELILEDCLPRELHGIFDSRRQTYAGFGVVDREVAMTCTPEPWQEEYLLKWQ